MGTCIGNYPCVCVCVCVCVCGPVMTGLCLPQMVCRCGGLGSGGGHCLWFMALCSPEMCCF